ncbi:MAG: carbohydrate kinase family protein [Candidatus Bathyarchaeota archaeon]|nr:carbohydrate kinase family protein [Candidatus Bathyarchaeota archaeon]MDH5686472.1 carbohydrate kinase family protein [Candidatus Bathyarchaeota archaeon]
MRFDVVCFGALNVDRLYKVRRIAKAEEESVILDYKELPGGSAANTAVGLAGLGVKTGYIGKVADDSGGKLLLRDFEDVGVDTGGIITSEGGRSGSVMGFVDEEGERALYVDPGVNDLVDSDDIDLDYVSESTFLHLTSFVGEKPLEAQIRLVNRLPDVKVTLDPGELYARRGWSGIKSLIEKCFAVFPNENELRLLTCKDYEKGAKRLIDAGVRVVAVKLGRNGSYVTDGSEAIVVEPFTVKAMDTTGAGDAFCAGFLYGLVENKPLKECGALGNFVASRCITKMGAREGLPRLHELPRI